MRDISIIIAHRGNPMGLWSTVHSCIADLNHTNLDYEFCIVANGEGAFPRKSRYVLDGAMTGELYSILEGLDRQGSLGYAKVVHGNMSAPTARQYATERATGKHLFFFDNHCLVQQGYFRKALETMGAYGFDLLHSTTSFHSGTNLHYDYKLKLDTNFWANAKFDPKYIHRPYQCAAGGHGGFVVTSESWHQIGGYWKGFEGYAGEELTTDLQYWMRGLTVGIDPQLIHYHWAGDRGYARHFTDDYYRNLMMSAYIIGGEKQLWKTFDHFQHCTKTISEFTMYDLLEQAYYRSRDESKRLAGVRDYDLDEIVENFKIFDVSH